MTLDYRIYIVYLDGKEKLVNETSLKDKFKSSSKSKDIAKTEAENIAEYLKSKSTTNIKSIKVVEIFKADESSGEEKSSIFSAHL